MGIWNGFDTKPHVLPQACVICAGDVGGEFIQFACGHGGIDQDPLHVACAVESFNPPDPDAPQPARCPLCREEVDQDMLAILADYVQRNAVVAFPNDTDQRQRESICETLFDQEQLMQVLVEARERCTSKEQFAPSEQEYTDSHYKSLLQEASTLAEQVEDSVEERAYTREELQEKLSEIDALNQRIAVCAGRAAQFECAGWPRQPSFEDMHDRLTVAQYRLQEVESRARLEYEEERLAQHA